MSRLSSGRGDLILSPTDLSGFAACPHLTSQQVAVALDEIKKPYRVNRHADLIRREGEEHEARFLAELGQAGREVTTIDFEDCDSEQAARETQHTKQVEQIEAMAARAWRERRVLAWMLNILMRDAKHLVCT